MVKANELRIGNRFNRELISNRGTYFDPDFVLTEEWMGKLFSGDTSIALQDLHPIPLTPKVLGKIKCFYQLPHYTVQNSWMIDLGRDRVLSIACVGTPNEMVFITEEVPPEVKNIIVARNYDYDGRTFLHLLQNLFFDLTGTELIYTR